MDETDAVEALTAFGLSAYAAETFVGLQKLGTASASEVAQVTDVPRSQVYGATDELETFGLVDVREGSPKRYRPVAVDEARDLLFGRLRNTGEAAFDYLEDVHEQRTAPDDGQEAIWTTEGTDSIAARVTSLVREADERVLLATGEPPLFDDAVCQALTDAAATDAEVVVASSNEAVVAMAEDAGLTGIGAEENSSGVSVGRVLVTDHDTMLLSVLPSTDVSHIDTEVAFWSAGTGFAMVLSRLIRDQFV